MFQDDYRNEIENIKPDGYIKYRVRQRLKQNQKTPKARINKYFGTAIAALLCVALLISAAAVLSHNTPSVANTDSKTLMKSVKTYDGIYKELKKFKPSIWNYTWGYKNSDTALFVEEYATDDIDTGTGPKPSNTNGNATTAPTEGSAESSNKGLDHSETTTQVDGVDEADIVKTDGKFIYVLTQNSKGAVIKIIDAREKEPKQIESISLSHRNQQEMYLNGNRLVILGTDYENDKTIAVIYDVSDPTAPKELETCSQSGGYHTSRLIGNRLFIITDYYVKVDSIEKNNAQSFVPKISSKNFDDIVSPECIYLYNNCNRPEYTVVSSFDIKDGKMLSSQSVFGGSYTVYSSTENIITAAMTDNGKTQIARFKLNGNEIKLTATGNLSGSLLNQFSIDEYNNHFRFVLTETVVWEEGEVTKDSSTVFKVVDTTSTKNSLVILDGDLKETGKITDIAPDERVYSVRFMGDTAYFVTFRQVDPLFSVDVSDPKNPKIIGALKIPGFSNYLFPFGEGKLLGIGQNADETTGKTGNIKLSMFDISDPSNVTESDKTDINSYYSAALSNHKAILTDYGKNIISFAAHGKQMEQSLYVFSYTNGKFTQRLSEKYSVKIGIIRPLYIGDVFYIITEDELRYFDINTFEKLGSITLK